MLALVWSTAPATAADDAPRVLVRVNGDEITEADLEFAFTTRGVSKKDRSRVRERYLDLLVERRLMRQFLAGRKVRADRRELDRQVELVRALIERRGEDPDAFLQRIGYTPQTLREELALPVAWQEYARTIITPDRLRAYWKKNRARFDGTRRRARQVFLELAEDADPGAVERARAKLSELRKRIVDEELAFSEAARQHSQAPTAEKGGDVGWFPYRGRMPQSFTRRAFELDEGEISEPFRTPFGLHLVQVTEVEPGEYSLEDVRGRVWKAFSDELWSEIVAKQRAQTKIERAAD